jgi:hypothetical protein
MYMLTQALSVPVKKNRTVKIKKSDMIKFPEFVPIVELLTDEYWKEIFEKASKGKFPRGFSYENRYIIHKKTGSSALLPDDISGLGNTLMTFFRHHGKLYSQLDLSYMNSIAHAESQQDDPEALWKRIYKAKDARRVFIRNYINKYFSEHTQYVRNEIFTQINNGLDAGSLNIKNFIFDNGEIIQITGFQLVPDPEVEGNIFIALDKPVRYRPVANNLPGEFEVPRQYQHSSNWKTFANKFLKNSLSGLMANVPDTLSIPNTSRLDISDNTEAEASNSRDNDE